MKFSFHIVILLLTITLLGACHQENQKNKWGKIFKKHHIRGTFILKNLSSNEVKIYNKPRSDSAYLPASTFKILNSMIALQTSVINSINDTIIWDGVNRGYSPWNKDQTMKTALPISCVWFYQELARRIGKERMQKWLDKIEYGNKKIGKEIDRFWLDGDLKISANDQIKFLERLINNKLSFNPSIQKTVKELMITDSTQNYIIHSKTGWTNRIGWNIGYVETQNKQYIFAMNMEVNQKEEVKFRKLITYEILRLEGIVSDLVE